MHILSGTTPFEGNVGKRRRDERETIMILKDMASHKTGRPSSRRIQNGGGKRNSSIELLRLLSMLGSARVFAHFGLRPSPWR